MELVEGDKEALDKPDILLLQQNMLNLGNPATKLTEVFSLVHRINFWEEIITLWSSFILELRLFLN